VADRDESDRIAQPRFEVVSPLGRHGGLDPQVLAGRLPDLTGRRVAFVWDHVFKGEEMFGHFVTAAQQRYEGMEFLPHPTFGNIHGTTVEEHDAIQKLPERLIEQRIDAAIVGVGA
jgi:hypothetical protein